MLYSPCESCLCIPICRHKEYDALVNQCSIIVHYLFNKRIYDARDDFWHRLEKVRRDIQCTEWEIAKDVPTGLVGCVITDINKERKYD